MGALAYTTGRNIVFAQVQYRPSTTEGRNLLAHELAHVVQQSGSEGMDPLRSYARYGLSAGPMLTRKAVRALPGWSSPLFGKDNSPVTFYPSGNFRTLGFVSDMSALANADFLVQFVREKEALAASP
jgi:hypothetical protein